MNGEAKSVVSFAFAFGLMEGMSSDVENDLLSSDEEDKHNVENCVLCSCAHHACSPLLQRCLHEEEQRKVWHVTSLFGCDLHPSELNAGLNFESSVLLPTAAAFCPFFPSRMGCNSTVSVMGGLHKHYSVVQAGWNAVFFGRRMFSLDTCAAGVATQRTHVQALLMLLFVNSCCLKRGPTTLLFLNTVNLKNKLSKQQVGVHQTFQKKVR